MGKEEVVVTGWWTERPSVFWMSLVVLLDVGCCERAELLDVLLARFCFLSFFQSSKAQQDTTTDGKPIRGKSMLGALVHSAYTKHKHESKCPPEIRIDIVEEEEEED